MFPLLTLPDQLAKATRELIAKARDVMKVRHYRYSLLVVVQVYFYHHAYNTRETLLFT